jgi:hypothetical protein
LSGYDLHFWILPIVFLAMVLLTLFTKWKKGLRRKKITAKQQQELNPYVALIEENTESIKRNSEVMKQILKHLEDDENEKREREAS